MADPAALKSTRVLKGLALVVVVIVAFFAGMLVERLLYHAQRDEMLRRYNKALHDYQERLMQAEKQQQR
jgi:type II secretory pathway pseudopilin PulG